ncbi:MAG: indole-3-glycerol phosphate synthase TrpC [Acidobacteriota bacterium]
MSETFLDKILAVKRNTVERQKRSTSSAAIKANAMARRSDGDDHRLRSALLRTDRNNIIAEIKRASPSKGVINSNIDIVDVARKYSDGGAAAISVLTEEDFFKGSLADLMAVRKAVELPILRKDFVVDEFQIYESASAGADVVLLIVAALDDESLNRFLLIARDELGMDVIVEVHNADELFRAVSIGADIIGVNNRDLRTFEVSLDVSRRLIVERSGAELFISESGITEREQIEELRSLGFNGMLIGETLMRSGNARECLGEWI